METLKKNRNIYSDKILNLILEGKFIILNSNESGCMMLIDNCLELSMCFLKTYKKAVPVLSAFINGREILRAFTDEEQEKMFNALEDKMYETELRRLTFKRDSLNEEIKILQNNMKNEKN